jgi:hypothetical protein
LRPSASPSGTNPGKYARHMDDRKRTYSAHELTRIDAIERPCETVDRNS